MAMYWNWVKKIFTIPHDKVDVEIAYSGILPLCSTYFRPQEKQLCVRCAEKLIDWIDNQETGDVK